MVTTIRKIVQNESVKEFGLDNVIPVASQHHKAEFERLRNEENRLLNEQVVLEHQRQELTKVFDAWCAEWNKNEATYHNAFQEEMNADDKLFKLKKEGKHWQTDLAVCIKEEKDLEVERVAANEEIKGYNGKLGNLNAVLERLRPIEAELRQGQAAIDAELASVNEDISVYNAKRKKANDSVSSMISWLMQEARAGRLNARDVTNVLRNYQVTRRMSPVLYPTGVDRKACEANFISTNALLDEADRSKAAVEARKKAFAEKSRAFDLKTKDAAKKLTEAKALVEEKDKAKGPLSERSKKYIERKEALDQKKREWTEWITAAEDAKKKVQEWGDVKRAAIGRMVPLGDRCTPIEKVAHEWDARAKAYNTAKAKWVSDYNNLQVVLSQDKQGPVVAPAEAEKHPDKTIEHMEHEVVDKFVEGIAEQIERKGALSTAIKADKAKSAADALKEAADAKNFAADKLRKATQKLNEAKSSAAAKTGTARSLVTKEIEEKSARSLTERASAEFFEATAKEGVAKGLSEAAAKDLAKTALKQSFREAAKDFSVAFGKASFVWALLDPNEGIATDEQEHKAWAEQKAKERAEANKKLGGILKDIVSPPPQPAKK